MTDQRRSDLAKIHIAKKDLVMDDDTYRSMLWTLCRVKSAGKLDFHGRKKVLQHLKALGFRAKKPTATTYPGRPHNTDRDDQLKKIEALLTDMKLPWSFADSIAERMFQIKKVAWLREVEQKQAVIVSLVQRQKKEKSNGQKS